MYVESASQFDDDLQALLARRIPRGKEKYNDKLFNKLPIIYFTCKKVGHISTRYIDRDDKEEMKDSK